MEFDLLTILPPLAAFFLLWKLRSVLGTRNGHERPPQETFEEPGAFEEKEANDANDANDAKETKQVKDAKQPDRGNVIPLPVSKKSAKENIGRFDHIENKGLKKGFEAIYAKDSSFDPDSFLQGAKVAYEMILTAFNEGDAQSLKNLLDKDLYKTFCQAIEDRERRGEKMHFDFVGLVKAEIVAAEMKGQKARVRILFAAQTVSATIGADGETVSGDSQQVGEVSDSWTFERSVRAAGPNWILCATGG